MSQKALQKPRRNIEPARGPAAHLELPADTAIGYHLRLTSEQMREQLRERIEPLGVRLAQWQYLRVLWDNDGISQRDLSERVARMGPNTVSAINILERSGFVQRKPNKIDRRVVNVYLTPKARAMQDTLIEAAVDVMASVTEGITVSEMAALLKTLKKMEKNMTRQGRNK